MEAHDGVESSGASGCKLDVTAVRSRESPEPSSLCCACQNRSNARVRSVRSIRTLVDDVQFQPLAPPTSPHAHIQVQTTATRPNRYPC